jgi:hypothetical protein
LTYSKGGARLLRGRQLYREEAMQGSQEWFKVTLLFPLYDNDGNPFPEDVWDWWRNGMTALVRGFTDLGVVEGWFKGQSDRNRWIVVIVKTENEVDTIRKFLQSARLKFRQDAMYLEYHLVRYEEVK